MKFPSPPPQYGGAVFPMENGTLTPTGRVGAGKKTAQTRPCLAYKLPSRAIAAVFSFSPQPFGRVVFVSKPDPPPPAALGGKIDFNFAPPSFQPRFFFPPPPAPQIGLVNASCLCFFGAPGKPRRPREPLAPKPGMRPPGPDLNRQSPNVFPGREQGPPPKCFFFGAGGPRAITKE